MQALGQSYDSLVGQPASTGTGGSSTPLSESGELNYDELVVYDEHAALPSYLVVYSL